MVYSKECIILLLSNVLKFIYYFVCRYIYLDRLLELIKDKLSRFLVIIENLVVLFKIL